MFTPLAFSALMMGILGGPHCVAMCGAVCIGFNQLGGMKSHLQFLFGRLFGYAVLGGVTAMLINSVAWLSENTALFRPLWTFTHVAIFAWGLLLLLFGRHPVWVEHVGSRLWALIQGLSKVRMGVFFTGMLWAFMPCGLLYSALLISAMVANPIYGAFNMLMFALGSSVSLMILPWLWSKWQERNQQLSDEIGMRISGVLLMSVAAWAVWMDMMHKTKIWCIS